MTFRLLELDRLAAQPFAGASQIFDICRHHVPPGNDFMAALSRTDLE
ncbi:hypothetical protein [Ensifer sp. R-19]